MRRTGIALAMLLLAVVDGRPEGRPGHRTIERHYTPADRAAARYQYVPFDVPAGTGSLRIAYSYDGADGNNVIDLGLFEPGSLELGTRAFRGYSGGSKSEVVISAADTTPGYRAGALPAGTWHVMLGLYKVTDTGVDVTLTVETAPGPPPPAPAASTSPRGIPGTPPLRSGQAGPQWYKGALHTHTLHSDGAATPGDLVRRVRDAGFDFVFITDHNNTTHRAELQAQLPAADRPLWLVGEEVTTPGGHASVWGLDPGEWVDFRVRPEDRRMRELIDAAHRQGALFSINHPVSDCAGCSWEHDVDGIDAIEIWNGSHTSPESGSLLWDRLLTAGTRVTGVGASDWHRDPSRIDVANVRVYAPSLAPGAILDAIKAGRVIVARDGAVHTPDVVVRSGSQSARIGDTLAVSGPVRIELTATDLAGGEAVVISRGERAGHTRIGADGRAAIEGQFAGYVRVELFDADGAVAAATNPVFLSQR